MPLTNFGNEDFGPITLTDALTNSVNTVWATVGEKLGKRTMYEYMRRYGFNRKPLLDLPRDEMRASGVYDRNGELLRRLRRGRHRPCRDRPGAPAGDAASDGARAGGDRERRQPDAPAPRARRSVTGTAASCGAMKPSEQSEVMKPSTASALAADDEQGGRGGHRHGRRAARASTWRARPGRRRSGAVNQAWFIAFAPVQSPRVAIAVTVERTTGQGGTVAAPIAKQVMQALLR